ncbi:MAG: manganese efflux pump MntP family protein, partial [Porcipelethomonas sp.]
KDKITRFSHWIAFILLLFIGMNMIKESFSKDEEKTDSSLSVKTMFILAIATSIDALAVGVSLAFLSVNIIYAVSCIGAVTFIISAVGVKIGSVFGTKYKSKAEFAGGIILVLLGVKILLEHFNII